MLPGMNRFHVGVVDWLGLLAPTLLPVRAEESGLQERADRFLQLVNAGCQGLYRVEGEAQWLAATDVTPAHDSASEVSSKARAAFVGNPALIDEAKGLLQR